MLLESARCTPSVHESLCATWKFGSKMLTLFDRLAAIGYTGDCCTHDAEAAPEQNGSGCSREPSRSSTGHVCPGSTRLPVVALRFCVSVMPGLLLYTPVNVPIESRL